MADREVLTYRGQRGHALVDTKDVTEQMERIVRDLYEAENGCNIDEDGPCVQCIISARERLESVLNGDEL